MLIEIATIDVIAGREDDFAAAYEYASDCLLGAEGCVSATMTRRIDSPSRFIGIVRWESAEARRTNFRETDRYQVYANLLAYYLSGPPNVEHYTAVESVPISNSSSATHTTRCICSTT